jgi:acid phosphatase (class A)
MKNRAVQFALCAALMCASLNSACAESFKCMQAVSAPHTGYLSPEAVPDSMELLPPFPAPGSAALALDKDKSQKSLELSGSGTPRWEQAAMDACLEFPYAAETFSCALNTRITEKDTPHLYKLLLRTETDAGNSTKRAKEYYHRNRPFMVNEKQSCTPKDQDGLAKNGSYPSGHTAIGWTWALILSEIAPDRADAILARGLAFGESRVVCNVHWESDVAEGRVMGVSTVAWLHGDPVFRADLEAARAELAAVRAQGLPPQRDCAAEAAALAK